jgi:hypothetical protein
MAPALAGKTCCGAGIASAAPERNAIQRHKHSATLGGVDGERFCFANLDDVQAGAGTRRKRQEGRKGLSGRLDKGQLDGIRVYGTLLIGTIIVSFMGSAMVLFSEFVLNLIKFVVCGFITLLAGGIILPVIWHFL